jgi:hypothetical protein
MQKKLEFSIPALKMRGCWIFCNSKGEEAAWSLPFLNSKTKKQVNNFEF